MKKRATIEHERKAMKAKKAPRNGSPKFLPSATAAPEYIHTPDVAAILGCSDMTVRRLCVDGVLDGFRLTERGYFQIEKLSVERLKKARKQINFHGANRARW